MRNQNKILILLAVLVVIFSCKTNNKSDLFEKYEISKDLIIFKQAQDINFYVSCDMLNSSELFEKNLKLGLEKLNSENISYSTINIEKEDCFEKETQENIITVLQKLNLKYEYDDYVFVIKLPPES